MTDGKAGETLRPILYLQGVGPCDLYPYEKPASTLCVACPKSLHIHVHAFRSEHITGTNQKFSVRINGHIGTFLTVQLFQ